MLSLCFNPRTHSGCDLFIMAQSKGFFGFNPRTHSGCDKRYRVPSDGGTVSIHAPTRGATISPTLKILIVMMFQSTHPLGVRPDEFLDTSMRYKFQSTHPLGVRLLVPKISELDLYVSIHAPTRGATLRAKSSRSILAMFQSTHPLGVRRSVIICVCKEIKVSIHAPTRGATAYSVID